MTENHIAAVVVDAALKIHKTLGPGLLETVYQATLSFELRKRGLVVVEQLAFPVCYEGVDLNIGFRVDLLVSDKVIIEIKSVDILTPVHRKQLETYLRLTNKRLGLLINFNVELMKYGIQRVVNKLPE
jgi:GxxExxY protein